MKKVVVSVTNDLSTDNRVMRTIEVLRSMGFEPTFVGRYLANSSDFNPPYSYRRFHLWFNRGFLFYANYNLRLFFFLLFRRYDLYLSNDLDTLLPNFLISRLYRKPLIYDAHEYFTGVPEIQDRPLVKKVWTAIERFIFPRLKTVVTVNDSIASLYEKEYGMRPAVVRNIGDLRLPEEVMSRQELGLPEDKFIMINQGAGINVDRGMEEALLSLKQLPENYLLLIVGNGDAVAGLKQMARDEDLQERVIFRPRQPYLQMLQYTLNADCGLSLDKPNSLNYIYSLPNKLFDYIKCGLAIVASPVVEVKKVVEAYELGEVIASHDPRDIATAVKAVCERGKAAYQPALEKAARENNWEKEQQVWRQIFSPYA